MVDRHPFVMPDCAGPVVEQQLKRRLIDEHAVIDGQPQQRPFDRAFKAGGEHGDSSLRVWRRARA